MKKKATLVAKRGFHGVIWSVYFLRGVGLSFFLARIMSSEAKSLGRSKISEGNSGTASFYH